MLSPVSAFLLALSLFTVTTTVVFAQTGSTAAQGNSTAANRPEIHLHNYGEFNQACVAWTDGCRNCSRRFPKRSAIFHQPLPKDEQGHESR